MRSVAELHVETLTTAIDDDMRSDYQQALDSYERAKPQSATPRAEESPR